jgi:hypothetical protein
VKLRDGAFTPPTEVTHGGLSCRQQSDTDVAARQRLYAPFTHALASIPNDFVMEVKPTATRMSGARLALARATPMSLLVSPPSHPRPASLKLGLRAPRRTRDEFAGLDRLDRPELDEDDTENTPPSKAERKVA